MESAKDAEKDSVLTLGRMPDTENTKVVFMSEQQMDAIDQRQQREIDAQKIWIKALSVLCTLLLIMGVAIFGLLMESRNCPHPECPHHHAETAGGK